MAIASRDYISCDGYGNCYRYSSPWNNWGRWVFLGLCIVGIIFLGFVFACVSNRRRRRRNMQPYHGTGWAGHNQGPPPQDAGPYYAGGGPPAQGYPAPQYAAPQQGYYAQKPHSGGANEGYYNGQQNGVELQSPQAAAQR